MKDRQGKLRGQCTDSGCSCTDYVLPESGHSCASCSHPPPKHTNLTAGDVAGDMGSLSISTGSSPAATPLYASPIVSAPTSNLPPVAVVPPCPSCQKKPRHVMADTGVIAPFCSAGCEGSYPPGAPPPVPVGNVPFCPQCKTKLRYFDPGNGTVFAFCSFACDSASKLASGAAPASPVVPVPVRLCKYAGCGKPVAALPAGQVSEFCSREHAIQMMWPDCRLQNCTVKVDPQDRRFQGFCTAEHSAEASRRGRCIFPGCVVPRYCEKFGEKPQDFCSARHYQESLTFQEPCVRVLDRNEASFADVKKQFEMKWTKKEYGVPIVQSISQIMMNGPITSRYIAYKQKLIDRQPPIPVYGAGGPGNEQRRFHGTGMRCQLGSTPNNDKLCSASDCAVCGIIRSSFRVSKAQSNISFARFGAGTYFTSTSSKCHDYNTKSETGLGAGVRATFMVQVMIGLGCKLTTDNTTLKSAPAGYDSVLGETGDVLNYDELVIYEDGGMLPKYLVVYTTLPAGSPVPADVAVPRPAAASAASCQLAGCNRPVAFDPRTNQPFQYCGRAHATQAAQSAGGATNTQTYTWNPNKKFAAHSLEDGNCTITRRAPDSEQGNYQAVQAQQMLAKDGKSYFEIRVTQLESTSKQWCGIGVAGGNWVPEKAGYWDSNDGMLLQPSDSSWSHLHSQTKTRIET
eukprot:TRINITY_DN731_c0_g1_i1.p1 TRINITY_DN731_c0_g1~~TRINITY_DN731_c0_g1_i1.p1  ORF type:complete len:684 (-),score=107.90 TRINITY_DN731_c0_g1_i1:64-2115(-)